MSEKTDVVATHSLRVLHLEDSPRDAEMVRHKLDADGLACNILVANGKESFEGALTREPFDLIISDYNLPGYDGITALKHAQETHSEVPVILISGTVGDEEGVKCLQIGATDYLLKQRLDRLVPAVQRAVYEAERRRTQKRIEAALAESESRKAAILDSVLDCIVTVDAHGIVLEFNAAASRTFGYTKADAIGRPLAELIIPPRRREQHRAGLARYVATGEWDVLGTLIETTARRADGSEIQVEQTITAIRSGLASIFTGVLRDLTTRKHADDTRARLAAIVDSSDDAIVSMTLDGTMLTWNAGAERLYGYTASEMIGQSGARLVPAEKRDELPSMMERAARGDAGEPVETQRLRKDGSVVDISLVISPMTDAAGHVTSVSTIARDIRLQKRAEADLLDLANALERQVAVLAEQAALLDLAQDAIVVRDMHNRIMFWNRGAELMYGWLSQEAVGRDKEDLLKTEFSEPQEQIDATLLRDGRWEGEAIHHKRDGTPVTVASRWTVQRGADGGPIRILTINNDITKRRQAVEALRIAEERMRFALESAGVGIWDLDYATGSLRWSETLEAQYGLEPGTFDGTFEAFMARIHPDDRELVLETVGKAMASGVDFSIQNRSIWRDGTVQWLSGAGRIHLGPDGKPVRGIGISQNVTGQKRAEAELTRLNDEIQRQRLRVFRATMRTVQDIVNNLLNGFQLVRLEAGSQLPASMLTLIDQMIEEASAKLKALGDLKTVNEREMAVGLGIEYPGSS
ncbi:MAG: PAS domain S-box protein [Acidobacteriota bacterium]